MKKWCLMVVMLCLVPLTGAAEEISAHIQKQYQDLESFSSSFVQRLTNAATKEVEVRSGTITFAKPRRIRWETTEPEKELLLVGRDVVWDYFPDENVAYKYAVEQVLQSKTMLRFISGEANLQEDFVIENQGDDAGLIKLKLIPREPETNLVLAYIWVQPTTNMLGKVLVVDFFGNGNELELSNMVMNKALDPAIFTFTPPKGVDVEDASSS
ncbi:cell envelope biogenesis protein LolA [Desulfoplanes formicivorans]|uniref:Outer-membrane lipoprotein carrier protein n=2 Tax=Desulfoplanes formicivorans TaxID=1592317 RepID=A0A194AKG5_9BACT|nr:outer membrane lipoprotein chaperone LolA [Desulfoplanes formicivorans]GAU09204.1 cell envelope biogenesis protein LolA [Desulfoplanes formicivorans]